MILLPLCYAAPIAYYHYLAHYPCMIEVCGSYQKQTYANRCYIATSNGVEALSIPVNKTEGKTMTKDVRISNTTNWQTLHYRAIESAYSSSPFFEYFSDDIAKIYGKKYGFLLDFNLDLQNLLLRQLNYADTVIGLSDDYIQNPDNVFVDMRQDFSAKKTFTALPCVTQKVYHQVFGRKFGFLPNLSIFDLLFNLGLEGRIILMG